MNSLNDTVSCFDCLSFHPYIVFDVIVTQAVFENVFGNPLYTSQMFKRRLRNVLLDMVFSYLFFAQQQERRQFNCYLPDVFCTLWMSKRCLLNVFLVLHTYHVCFYHNNNNNNRAIPLLVIFFLFKSILSFSQQASIIKYDRTAFLCVQIKHILFIRTTFIFRNVVFVLLLRLRS